MMPYKKVFGVDLSFIMVQSASNCDDLFIEKMMV